MARQLEDSVELMWPGGESNLRYEITSGTAKLQYQVANEGFVDIPDTDKTASTGITVTLPGGRIQAVLTGDAQMWITRI
jgi:hypothetical protein